MKYYRLILYVLLLIKLPYELVGQITITNNGQLFIKENQTVHIDGLLINNSSAFENRGDFSLTGTFWNNADVNHSGIGTFRLIGDEDQLLILDQAFDVFDFQVDNSSAVFLNGDFDLGIFGTLDFTNGIINTFETSMIHFQNPSSYINSSTFSHINGPATKSGISDFIFPIGKNGIYRPSGISDLTDTTTFLSEYFDIPYTSLMVDGTLTNVSDQEYWRISKIFGVGNARITLVHDNDFGNYNVTNELQIAQWRNPWTKVISFNNNIASPSFLISQNILSEYGLFTLSNEIKSFISVFEGIQKNDCVIELSWLTEPGSATSKFEIEFSTDSINFITIGEIIEDSTISNTPRGYIFQDENLYTHPELYYRVKNIAPNGSYFYTPIIRIENECIFEDCVVFPNPVKSQSNLQLRMFSEEERTLTYQIHDVLGRTHLTQELAIEVGNQTYDIETKKLYLSSGTYFLQLGKNKNLKFVVIND